MEEYIRDGYTFKGPKAADSIEYYDLVISRGYSGDMHYLAIDAAHKFGSKVIGHGGAYSLRGGWVSGENAEAAAAYIDAEWKKHYAACPEFNRSKLMREAMHSVCRVDAAKNENGIVNSASGSGFCAFEPGLLVTAYHVVKEFNEYAAYFDKRR